MASWHKEEEEASRRRATKRKQRKQHHREYRIRLDLRGGDTIPTGTSAVVVGELVQTEDTTAGEESRREMAERVARYVPD